MTTDTYTPTFPDELTAHAQWIIYRLEEKDEGRPGKIPVDPATDRALSWNHPGNWYSFAEAQRILSTKSAGLYGLGFVITAEDTFVCVDLDGSVDEKGCPSEFAQGFLSRLNSFTELSVSCTGLHIWCTSKRPLPDRTKDIRKAPLEVYQRDRWIAVTGWHAPGTPMFIRDCTDELAAIHAQVFGESTPNTSTVTGPAAGDTEIDIGERIRMARDAVNGPKFWKLWTGDMSEFADGTADGADHSAADQALCCHLAFWLNRDARLIDEAFRKSALFRPKWNRPDYREHTIAAALRLVTDCYKEGRGQRPGGTGDPAKWSYRLTDTGNGHRFVDLHRNRAMFVPGRGWYVWTGTVWKQDADGAAVFELAKDVAGDIRKEGDAIEADDEETTKLKEAVTRWASTTESVRKLSDMLKAAQTDPCIRVPDEELDRHYHLLTFTNGVLDLRTGKLSPPDPLLYLTQLVPRDYEPDAASDTWTSFLRTITKKHPDLPQWLQKVWGYAVTGYKAEEKVLLFEGEGGAGKGTLFSILKAAFGKDVVKDFRAETFLDSNRSAAAASSDLIRLRDCRIAISSEINKGSKMAESLVKSISGNDGITGRALFQNEGEFRAKCQLIFQANGIPTLDAVDGGNLRRWLRVPFDNKIAADPETTFDPHLKDRLSNDPQVLRAVIAWVVEGSKRYYAEGLGTCPSVEQATRELFEENDRMLEFINRHLIRDTRALCPNAELFKAYKTWAEEANEFVWSQKRFTQEMKRRGFEQEDNGHRRWMGIRIRRDADVFIENQSPQMKAMRDRTGLHFSEREDDKAEGCAA